jgi:predicted small secreted protein
MRKSLLMLAAWLLLAGPLAADTFRVHYSIRGAGRDITVLAESSAEARRTVQDMFGPAAVVTGVRRVK